MTSVQESPKTSLYKDSGTMILKAANNSPGHFVLRSACVVSMKTPVSNMLANSEHISAIVSARASECDP